MHWTARVILVAMLGLSALSAQVKGPEFDPARSVGIKGTIERIQFTPGEGFPSLDIRSEGRLVQVLLGPMRYLMELGFNPKAGMEVQVEGFPAGNRVVARKVTLGPGKNAYELRDPQGKPLWRGGGRRQQRMRQGGK